MKSEPNATCSQSLWISKLDNKNIRTLLITLNVKRVNSSLMGTDVIPSAQGFSFSIILSAHSLKEGTRFIKKLKLEKLVIAQLQCVYIDAIHIKYINHTASILTIVHWSTD